MVFLCSAAALLASLLGMLFIRYIYNNNIIARTGFRFFGAGFDPGRLGDGKRNKGGSSWGIIAYI